MNAQLMRMAVPRMRSVQITWARLLVPVKAALKEMEKRVKVMIIMNTALLFVTLLSLACSRDGDDMLLAKQQ